MKAHARMRNFPSHLEQKSSLSLCFSFFIPCWHARGTRRKEQNPKRRTHVHTLFYHFSFSLCGGLSREHIHASDIFCALRCVAALQHFICGSRVGPPMNIHFSATLTTTDVITAATRQYARRTNTWGLTSLSKSGVHGNVHFCSSENGCMRPF
jgi:hypothetical protein